VLLCYPAIFQTDSPAAAGLRNLPKHVWTSTTEVEGERTADVEVRQVWVHGDYMKAIERRVLRQALHVQNVLIGSGFDEGEPGSNIEHPAPPEEGGCLTSNHGRKWGFHSPLMFWNCSLQAMEQDNDLLATINSQTSQHSGLNITLRPSTVFAGKAFANKKLRAADALVITLFDQTKSTLGYAWDTRSRDLAQELPRGWSIFPKDGQISRSRLYEFRFKPMTLSDDLLLGGSYLFVALYVIWRMMQLRAVKSKSGLLVTICAKVRTPSLNRHYHVLRMQISDDHMRHCELYSLYISRHRSSSDPAAMVPRRRLLLWSRKHVGNSRTETLRVDANLFSDSA
jgi:hypothetical protein